MAEPPRLRSLASAAALVHAAVAGFHIARGVSIRHDFGPSTWDWFWQNLPTADLRERALESLWYLHAQPPLWNALNAVLIKAVGAAHPELLHLLHVGMGAAAAGLAVLIAGRLTGSVAAAAVAGALVALDPALVMYEAYVLYEMLRALLIMLAVYGLMCAAPAGRTGPLVLALAALTALVLTRSLYHLALLAVAVVGAAALARRRHLVLACGVALAFVPAGWYAKNLVQYGFFGVSSWYGIGLWRVALFRYESEELTPLLADGTLHPVVTVNPFSLPSRYRRLGYVGASEVPSLSRNDFHNVNVPAISAAYGRSARRLVLRDPLHYLGNVLIGYGNFSAPSTESDHLIPERDLMGAHVTLWRALTGLPLVRVLDRALPIGTLGTFFLVLIPLGLVALAGVVGRRLRRGEGIEEVLREEAALIGAGALILYTALVGSALELGENVRFKFMIEPLLLTFWTVVAVRAWRALWPDAEDAGMNGMR